MNVKVITYRHLGDFSAIALLEGKDKYRFWRIRVNGYDVDLTLESLKDINKVAIAKEGN